MTPTNRKDTAHYPLAQIKLAFAERRIRLSKKARDSMIVEGMDSCELVEHVQSLRAANCHQSVTDIYDHTVWLDSYLFRRADGMTWYLKFKPNTAGPQGEIFVVSLHPSDAGQPGHRRGGERSE